MREMKRVAWSGGCGLGLGESALQSIDGFLWTRTHKLDMLNCGFDLIFCFVGVVT